MTWKLSNSTDGQNNVRLANRRDRVDRYRETLVRASSGSGFMGNANLFAEMAGQQGGAGRR